MNLHSNQHTYNYIFQSGRLNVLGNKNRINLKNCNAGLSILGNENLIKISDSLIKISVQGMGNKLILIGVGQVSLGVKGNANQIQFQQQKGEEKLKLEVYQNNGLGNKFPISKKLDFRNPFYQQSKKNPNQNQMRIQNLGMRSYYSFYNPIYPSYYHNHTGNRELLHNNFRPFNYQIRNYQSRGQNFNQNLMRHHEVRPAVRQLVRPVEDQINNKGLTQEQIKVLPISVYQGQQKNCTICLDSINQEEQIIFLTCFHCFHSLCIIDWLKQSATCPICQVNIKKHLKQI